MKYAILLVSVVFLSACVSQLNPFSKDFNPFNIFKPQDTIRPTEGLAVSLSVSPQQVFAGSKAVIYFDAQNRDIAPIRDIFLEIFDTGNLARESRCQLSVPQLLPDQIASMSCNVQAPKELIKKAQTEPISARAKFQSVLAAVHTFDIMSEEVYVRENLAGNIKSRPRSYAYRDKNVEMAVEFSEMPVIVRQSKQYFVYFTIKNIGNGFVGDITFGKNFMPVEQRDLKFTEAKKALTAANTIEILTALFKMTGLEEKDELSCKDVLCCRDFKTIYPVGKTFPRIACELRLQQDGRTIEQLVDYQILVPLVYDYEVRAAAQLQVVK